MAYQFKADETVAQGVQRLARNQIDQAVAELTDPTMDVHESVHQFRKRCKKIRALLRVVRDPLGEVYARENAWYRDRARRLSGARDVEAGIETTDHLIERFDQAPQRPLLDALQETLVARRDELTGEQEDLQPRIGAIVRDLRAARRRVGDWPLVGGGFELVIDGLKRTYRRGGKALRQVEREPTPEAFHEWRKRVKYHWYHARLLRGIWPEVISGYRKALKQLADMLGTDHDLAVLKGRLRDLDDSPLAPYDAEAIVELIDQRHAELARRVLRLGSKIYAEKPKRLARRFGRYWRIWRRATARPLAT
jgi:CHAD domain-containing protein